MHNSTSENESGPIAWFVRNPVAANILMGILLVAGILSFSSIKREVFPQSDTYQINIAVPYPGAAPEEVEEGICERIENEIFGLEGVKRIRSSATEGAGTVTVEVMREFDVRDVLDEVKSRIDSIDNFPEEARKPVVREVALTRNAVSIAVSGDLDERSLKNLGEKIRDDLSDRPEITQVVLNSARAYEISVEVSEAALRRHGLTMTQIANSIREASIDLPGGSVRTEGGEVMLRSVGQRRTGSEFEDLIVLTRPNGAKVYLRDVATVIDGFADSDESSRFNGERAVIVQAFRVGDQDVVTVVDSVKKYVAETRPTLPDGVTLTVWSDETVILNSRIDLLTRNLLTGLALVFLMLAIFLRLRLAFWVALGIPISFFGCAALMPFLGISVNMISLFAFLMVLGIVVDDAIVVGESVYSHRRKISNGETAAIRGAKIVSVPVTFGVLTTIAAFTPMLNMNDNAARLWMDIGLIVIFCLLFSLIESKFILPAHLAHSKFDGEPSNIVSRSWSRFRGVFTGGLDWFVEHIYQPVFKIALRSRYVTVAIGVAIFVLTVALVQTGYIKTTYFPPMEGDNVVANLELPQGTPARITAEKVRILETAARKLKREINGDAEVGDIRHILASVGNQPFNVIKSRNGGRMSDTSSYSGSHLGEVNIQLAPSELRTVGSEDLASRWKEIVGAIPDVEDLSFSTDLFGTGKDVNVQLAGKDIGDLSRAAEDLKDYLGTLPGVSEISDSFRGGKREIQLRIKPAAETLGLSQRDLALQVRQGFYGEEVQRIQKKGEDVRVMVRYPQADRESLTTLRDMRIRTLDGSEVPFDTVAEATFGRGFAAISRTSRARTINVTAKVDPGKSPVSANEIAENLEKTPTGPGFLPQLLERYPSLTSVSFEGNNRDQAETQESLKSGYSMVLFLIYALLAIPLRSYFQPLLVMSAIPFGFIGAILGHGILGLELSIMSMFGFVALTGVVVNDNLVLIDFINRRRREGAALLTAVRESGAARFRPILLTSLTTCASLTPLLLERSVQAKFLIPMGVSLAFGVLFATMVSLILVPCGYVILDDLAQAWRWLLTKFGFSKSVTIELETPTPRDFPTTA